MILCSSITVCAAKPPLFIICHWTAPNFPPPKCEMWLIYCQKVKTCFQNQLPFPESHSVCSKPGFTMLACRLKKDLKNLSECFSLLPCAGKLKTDEMHLSRKNHSLNFAIQSLFKPCCKTVEQHVGRYFLRMDNNLCPSSR